jgi:hypothetical protein
MPKLNFVKTGRLVRNLEEARAHTHMHTHKTAQAYSSGMRNKKLQISVH